MRTAHPKLGHKSLLIAECHRLRSMIDERDKVIEGLERKLDPLKYELQDRVREMSRNLDKQMFGLEAASNQEDVPK